MGKRQRPSLAGSVIERRDYGEKGGVFRMTLSHLKDACSKIQRTGMTEMLKFKKTSPTTLRRSVMMQATTAYTLSLVFQLSRLPDL